MSKGSVMKTNLDPAKCPFCGSPEVEYPTPRTVYSCGTNEYDGRPESAMQSETCKERVLAKPVYTTQFEKKFGIKEEDCKNKYELWYFKTLLSLIEDGTVKDDRTNTGTRSIPFHTYQHDLRESYPLMKSRYLDPFNPIKEMIWMLSGSSNVKPLQEMGVPFWNSFADEDGELGPVYGVQWRHWKTPDGEEVDQIQYVLDLLENEPTSRRMVVSCWNPSFIPVAKTAPKDNPKLGKMSLTACHFSFVLTATPMNFGDRLNYFKHSHPTIYSNLYPISGKGWAERAEEAMNHRNVPKFYLDLSFIMRSNDFILGNPANLNEYAALCMMFAQQRNMIARYVNYTGIDVHVYSNHIAGAREQIDYVKKHPEIFTDEPAKMHIGLNGKPNTIFEYTVDHFVVQDYHRENTGPVIRFPIAV